MEWNRERLESVLAQMRARRGDSTTVEIKRASGGVPRMAETICAFANLPGGGTIILGVDEAQGDFTITGIPNVVEYEGALASMAREAVEPSPHLEFHTVNSEGKNVLIADVAPLPLLDMPARVGGRAFLRQADGDYPMHEYELRMLDVTRLHAEEQIDYDLAPATGLSSDDLDPDLTAAYIRKVRAQQRRLRELDDNQILRITSVINSAGEPTLAGLYALGQYPQGLYPALTVTAAVQLSGGEGQARNRNLQDFTGPLPVLLEELLEWVASNVDTVRAYGTDGHLRSVPELPLSAVRELLANALVHRDLGPNTLGTGKQIQVRLTPRNLFILSPGGLRGISLDQLVSVEHAQAAVNQRLYAIAKKLTTGDGAAVIEGEGGGIREVFRSTSASGLPRPLLIDTGVQFKALLWRDRNNLPKPTEPGPKQCEEASPATDAPDNTHAKGPDSPTVTKQAEATPLSTAPTKNEGQVLAALGGKSPLTIHELVDATGLSIGQVRYALAQPLKDGIVSMDGKQGLRSTRYRLI